MTSEYLQYGTKYPHFLLPLKLYLSLENLPKKFPLQVGEYESGLLGSSAVLVIEVYLETFRLRT